MTTIFIISAPSGSGKSTLVSRLLECVPSLLFSVSYTTRAPRGKEVDGIDYHFVSQDRFQAMRDRGEFLESAGVFGKCYGTHREVLDRARAQGNDLVLDIDVQGARQLKGKFPEAVTVFILPPSREELEVRLRARGEDSEEVIQRRLRDAAEVFARVPLIDLAKGPGTKCARRSHGQVAVQRVRVGGVTDERGAVDRGPFRDEDVRTRQRHAIGAG